MSTGPREPLRLTSGDLFTPQVEAYLDEQRVLRRDVPEVAPRPFLVRIFYSSYFYLSLAAGLGAFVAWLILEPLVDDSHGMQGGLHLAWLLMFPTVGAFIALFLGAAEGLMCRNPLRMLTCAAVGLGCGFAGGLITLFAGGFVFGLALQLAVSFMQNPQADERPTGIALLILMMGRSVAWAIVAIPSGLGQGIALREKKVVLNGLLGSVLGGLLGGLLFDPIDYALSSPGGQAAASRAVGFTTIGLMVGLFVGIVEQWTKTAWLLMKAGPLAGKQFIIFRNPTVLGSSPKADIYLFKDEAIEPRHALIHARGGRYEIEDQGTADGTYVNGIPVTKRILQTGDVIVMGKTMLEFSLRES
jgi:hypothetical protein